VTAAGCVAAGSFHRNFSSKILRNQLALNYNSVFRLNFAYFSLNLRLALRARLPAASARWPKTTPVFDQRCGLVKIESGFR
jgi:hypothetical protein